MSSEKSPSALRTIGEVADELGLAPHVLRFWESKFNQIKPQKRRGRRYYRPEDIKTITQIKALLYGQGYTIRGVQKFFVEGRHKMIEHHVATPAVQQQNVPAAQQSASAEASRAATTGQATGQDNRQRDLFGNIIDDGADSLSSSKRSAKETAQLQELHEGLKTTRNKLKDVA